jgi:hypothetical protein
MPAAAQIPADLERSEPVEAWVLGTRPGKAKKEARGRGYRPKRSPAAFAAATPVAKQACSR